MIKLFEGYLVLVGYALAMMIIIGSVSECILSGLLNEFIKAALIFSFGVPFGVTLWLYLTRYVSDGI